MVEDRYLRYITAFSLLVIACFIIGISVPKLINDTISFVDNINADQRATDLIKSTDWFIKNTNASSLVYNYKYDDGIGVFYDYTVFDYNGTKYGVTVIHNGLYYKEKWCVRETPYYWRNLTIPQLTNDFKWTWINYNNSVPDPDNDKIIYGS